MYIVRDTLFTLPGDDDLPKRPTVHYARPSLVKQIERRIVGMWKLMTKKGRKPPRNSFIARDFIPVNRRRSAFCQHLSH